MGKNIARAGILAALLAALVAPKAVAQEGAIVTEIVFQGERSTDDSTLKYSISTKEGKPLSEARLAEDVSTLLTFFDRVTVEKTPVPGGVRIKFIVEENPAVTSVVFQGFTALKTEEIQSEVFTKKGYPFAEFKVEQDRTRLEDLLKAKGYYFAEVKVATGELGRGRQVVFTAIEGPEVSVEDILFVGNDSFPEDDLEDVMALEESWFLSSGPFVMSTLEQDLIAIRNFYRERGYLDAIVDLRDLSFSPDREEVTITIGVVENEPYVLTAVTIEGAGAAEPELEPLLKTEIGAPRSEEDLTLTTTAIRRYYLENAYYDVGVDYVSEDDSVAHTSRVTIRVKPGEPARIRHVSIAGNTDTREDVVRRNLSVYPGGPLNSIEIEKSKSRLEATGYFETGPEKGIRAKVTDTNEEGVKDVTFSLTEGRTGSLRFSAGVTSDLGLVGLIQLSKKNFDYADLPERFGDVIGGRAFTGGGQTLDIQLSPGSSLSQYQLAFVEPWFFEKYLFYGPSDEVEESPFSLGFDIRRTAFTKFDYDEYRTGFGLSTGKSWRKPGHRIDDVYSAKISFRWENVRLDDLESDAPPSAFVFEGLNQTRKFSIDLGWDHVDLPAAPGAGFEADLGYMVCGGPFGGEIDFHRVEASTTHYLTLYTTREEQRHILALTGQVGWAKEFGGTDQVPLYDRFFLGGQGTVRGFAYRDIGPRAEGNPFTNKGKRRIRRSLADGDGDPLGGEGMWLGKAEYGFPLYADILRGVAFVDAGNVADTFDRDFLNRFRASVGVGLRIKIPFFGPIPVALDFGFPVRKEKGDDTQVISFFFDRPF